MWDQVDRRRGQSGYIYLIFVIRYNARCLDACLPTENSILV